MKTKLFFAIGLLVSTIAFGSNKLTSGHDGTVKNNAGLNTLPVFSWDKYSKGEFSGNSHLLVYSYLRENVKYPDVALKYNIQGTEVVQFTVTTTGEVTNIKVVNSVCPEIDDEVVRVLKTTNGMWNPGLKNGEPADMENEITMAFQMRGINKSIDKSLFKDQATVYYKKGSKALISQNNPEKALKYFDKALNYLPYESSILYSRGMANILIHFYQQVYAQNPFKLNIIETELASLIGTSRESVIRLLKDF